MTPFEQLKRIVKKAGRRRRGLRAWNAFWTGFLVGAGVFLGALGAYKLLPLPMTVVGTGGALGVAAAFLGLIIGAWRGEIPLATARWIDRRQQLQERLSSAIELARDVKHGRWGELLLEDANRHISLSDVRRILPYTLPRSSLWALLLLLLAAGLGFVPEYRGESFLHKQRETENVRETGRRLAEVTRRDLERRAPALDVSRRAVESVAALGEQMAKKPMARAEALRELARLTDKVQQQAREVAQNPSLKSLDRQTRDGSAKQPSSSDTAREQTDSADPSEAKPHDSADALEQLERNLRQAAQAAQTLRNDGSRADQAARDNLTKALSNLAEQARESQVTLPNLDDAISALEAGQIDQVLKDLDIASRSLEQLADTLRAMQRMQQAQALGKDLAEQLENGQAEAARSTLERMVSQLKRDNLGSDRLKAILDEVSRAIGPASPYGKVPDLLEEAANRLQGKDKPGAAQSLADAASELGSLIQQMAEAEGLQGALAALGRAQAAIGSGKNWSMVAGEPGFNRGGRPGRGVGTWADEEGWIEQPPFTGRWDNSGIERPAMAQRGVTDRGEGQVPDGMIPTSIKGKLSPGSQMPSITLKGLSLKGSSTLVVQEAIQAAQNDAQAALSQDQIPRAYQGPVRDYFGDLK